MKKDFKSFYQKQVIKALKNKHKKKKSPKKDSSKSMILPGAHRTEQQIGTPNKSDAPSASTYASKG